VLLFLHNSYDYVIFLFPLCLAIRHLRVRSGQIVFAVIIYFWFVVKALDSVRGISRWTLIVPGFILMVTLFVSLIRLASETAKPAAESVFGAPNEPVLSEAD
jgi:hypothetical protein